MTVYWYWDGKAWYPQYVEDGHYDLQYHNPFFGHEHYDFGYYRSPYARSPCFDMRHYPVPHYDVSW